MKKSTLDAFAKAQLAALGMETTPDHDKVLDFVQTWVKKHKQPATPKLINEKTGVKIDSCGRILTELVKSREVVKVGIGLYVPVVTK